MTTEYKEALANSGFRAFAGEDASWQPGSIPDVLLHETAVAWIRYLTARTLPKTPWQETWEQFDTRLKAVVEKANEKYAVGNLCKQFPKRIGTLLEKDGDKLKK